MLCFLSKNTREKMMKKIELPLVAPLCSTFHYQGVGMAIIKDNPLILHWYLNYVIMLTCTKKFLNGFTTPELTIAGSSFTCNPNLERVYYPMRFAQGYINAVIRQCLRNGYYVYFTGVDDYYIPGKTWYKERHFEHDGLICGYDAEKKSYCLYAYDKTWVYRKFWVPCEAWEKGRKAMAKKGVHGVICGVKPKMGDVEFIPIMAADKIKEYLRHDMKTYEANTGEDVAGVAVMYYILKYLEKLKDDTIPYERTDKRVFCLIRDHKALMLERIKKLEETLNIPVKTSHLYQEKILSEANTMHMLYASYNMRQKKSILDILQRKMRELIKAEEKILKDFVKKAERKIDNAK